MSQDLQATQHRINEESEYVETLQKLINKKNKDILELRDQLNLRQSVVDALYCKLDKQTKCLQECAHEWKHCNDNSKCTTGAMWDECTVCEIRRNLTFKKV